VVVGAILVSTGSTGRGLHLRPRSSCRFVKSGGSRRTSFQETVNQEMQMINRFSSACLVLTVVGVAVLTTEVASARPRDASSLPHPNGYTTGDFDGDGVSDWAIAKSDGYANVTLSVASIAGWSARRIQSYTITVAGGSYPATVVSTFTARLVSPYHESACWVGTDTARYKIAFCYDDLLGLIATDRQLASALDEYAVADLDGDGLDEILTYGAGSGQSAIVWSLNRSTGQFASNTTLTNQFAPLIAWPGASVVVLGFNHTAGAAEGFVVYDQKSHAVRRVDGSNTVCFGHYGCTTTVPRQAFQTGARSADPSTEISVGDVDGDGFDDVVFSVPGQPTPQFLSLANAALAPLATTAANLADDSNPRHLRIIKFGGTKADDLLAFEVPDLLKFYAAYLGAPSPGYFWAANTSTAWLGSVF
jgi:FG-GAP repeat